jgi:hypothetical protein
MTTSQTPTGDTVPDNATPLPAMLSHYAAYMRARARVTPQVRMNGHQADVRLNFGTATLVAVFGCRKKTWSLRSIQVHRGERTATFNRGELAKALATLLGQQPMTPTPQAVSATSGPRTDATLRERRATVIRT